MKGNNILSSLCYFSIFFAPFLFPLIVYFMASKEVKVHAKKSLCLHLFPYIILVVGLAGTGLRGISGWDQIGIGFAVTYVAFIIIGVYFFFWNIVKGVKILADY
ncbi:DUF4870 domain-containing protein [Priestia filamentosa]|uniref:DUF4870 domain-containing protein n=1 Tax=Priestia filamentosa TaxID=1402861 RepID=UPI000A08A978|nr:DUF4870 domain-containing protein [Priestia filamentosa]MDT3766117.1 DUF4870 domain-containing protein [Priestia filamentosa]OXS65175.1 DUF4870 domain-containing protein [Priestia filamentosa]SMF71100.1 hypothetical protein SAMN06296056_11253 [Priestia filamentosa]